MAITFKKIWHGLRLVAKSTLSSSIAGEIETSSVDSKTYLHNGTSRSPILTEGQTATLTNKTFDANGTGNSITNIENADIAAAAAIDASKIANGLVSNTEFQYLDGVTSSIQTQLNGTASAGALTAHINNTTDAHDASAISNIPSGNLAATDIQGAVNELQSDIDTRATSTSLTSHTGASSGVHGVVGSVVGTSDAQTLTTKTIVVANNTITTAASGNLVATELNAALAELQGDIDTRVSASGVATLTNKTIDGDDNTIQDLALTSLKTNITDANKFLVRNGSGVVVSNTKDVPTGVVVGTTDTQTLTNKTFGDAATFTDISTPSTPSAGTRRLYSKTDGSFYQLDSSGNEVAIGSGAGGGECINFYTKGDLESASSSDFTTGNNATFDGGGTLGGTFTLSTTSTDLIRGNKSAKLVGSATSGNNTNDYIASTNIAIPQGYRGRSMLIKFRYRWDGTTGNVKVVVKDATNGTIISSNLDILNQYIDATNKTSQEYQTLVTIPATAANIKVGFQIITGEVSKTLIWDDFVVSSCVDGANSTGINRISEIRTTHADGYGSTDTKVRKVNAIESSVDRGGLSYTNDSTNGFVVTVKSPGFIVVCATDQFAGATDFGITLNATQLTTGISSFTNRSELVGMETSPGANQGANVSWGGNVVTGDKIRIMTDVATASGSVTKYSGYRITHIGTDQHILVPSDTFSTDLNTLTYASSASYTLSTLENAPVGTFITYTIAASSNSTYTQTTTAPSQSTNSMNTNGIQIFTRAYTAASTSGDPARLAIQIGKGLKGVALAGYISAAKTDAASLDFFQNGNTVQYGLGNKNYNEKTGVLILDAGTTFSSSNTTSVITSTETNGVSTSAYIVVNASRIQPNIAIPVAQTVYLKDVKASGTDGGTFTSGSYQTRVLNTVEGITSLATLSSNQFTLQPGVYEIDAKAPAFRVNYHKAKIRNITDSTDAILGTIEYTASTDSVVNSSFIKGQITITSSKTFELQHRCSSTDTFGVATAAFGDSEVYSVVKITKIR